MVNKVHKCVMPGQVIFVQRMEIRLKLPRMGPRFVCRSDMFVDGFAVHEFAALFWNNYIKISLSLDYAGTHKLYQQKLTMTSG